MSNRIDKNRRIKAQRGTQLEAKNWLTEAALRMLRNNLDPNVAEMPAELVVYGGIGKAAKRTLLEGFWGNLHKPRKLV